MVKAGDEQRLDQEMSCVLFEERPDPAGVLEGKSAGSGHSSDAGGAGQSVGNTVTSSTVTDSSMRGQSLPRMKRTSVLLRLSIR